MDALGGRGEEAARAWYHERQEAPCDEVSAWEHGTIVRASRHPGFYFHNAVRVEDASPPDVEKLIAFANGVFAGRCHMIVFDDAAAAETLRPEMEALGWRTCRMVLMLHALELPEAQSDEVEVVQVHYDVVRPLRMSWQHEDFPGHDPADFLASAREIDLASNCTVLAAFADGIPIGFAELVRSGDGAEITAVYVDAAHRGRGLGTALTRAAIERGSGVRELWIGADDEDRPKRLYSRLGFRAAWTSVEFLLIP